MGSEDSKKSKVRVGLIIIVAILVVLAGMQLFFSLFLDTYIEKRLTTIITERTNGQYELEMDKLNLSIWGSALRMDNIRFHPVDTASTAPKIDVEQFSVSSIQFFPYLFNGSIYVGQVKVLKPKVSFVQDSSDSLTFLRSKENPSISKNPPVVEVGQFLIENGAAAYWTSDLSETRGELNDFNLDLSDIRIDSSTQSQPPYFAFSAIQTSSGKFRYHTNNGLYSLESNGIDFSSSGNHASVDSLKLTPKFPKYEFSKTVGHQLDRIELKVKQLRLQNPDIEKLKSGVLRAEKFTIQNANLEVFHSKLLPSGPETEKIFPQVAFKNLKYQVSIDTIAIRQSEISYSEHLPEVSKPGTVTFANINGTFTDVTNDSVIISRGHEIKLDVTSEVMSEALLTAHFVLPMHENGGHSVTGTLGSMQAEKLNPVLEPVGLVRAENGTLHSLQFLMDLGESEATGWVLLVYSDLKIEVLDEKNVGDGGRQRFKTFLANAFRVRADNNREPLRKGEISMERNQKKSIFSYWWNSLSAGLKDNIGM